VKEGFELATDSSGREVIPNEFALIKKYEEEWKSMKKKKGISCREEKRR
jgi:hypothetical protein